MISDVHYLFIYHLYSQSIAGFVFWKIRYHMSYIGTVDTHV